MECEVSMVNLASSPEGWSCHLPLDEAEHFHGHRELSLRSPSHSQAEAQRLGSEEGSTVVGDADGI